MYGVDVAKRRADDLDKAQLAYIETLQNPRVLDIGCGNGGQSGRLAAVGAQVIGVDVGNYAAAFTELQKQIHKTADELQFVHGAAEQVIDELRGTFNSVTFQRTIHYLAPLTAKTLLQKLKHKTTGKLFLSVTGCQSAIGELLDCSVRLQSRMAMLPAEAQLTFSIYVPICPYTSEELEQLVTDAGWRVEKSWTSAFGNHKLIAT